MEVELGLSEEQAVHEAERCLQVAVKPDMTASLEM